MDAEPMVRGPVDHVQLDIEPGRISLERYGKPNRKHGIDIGTASAILAEPAGNHIVEARLETAPKRAWLGDGAGEVANWTGQRRAIWGRREVVLITGIALVDQPVERRVVGTRLSVDHDECAVRTQVAGQVRVFKVHRTGDRWDARLAAGERADRATGNH